MKKPYFWPFFSFFFVFASGCGIDVPTVDLKLKKTQKVWTNVEATDIGALNSSLLAYSGNKSFSDFVLRNSKDKALLITSLYDGAQFRGYARTYYRQGGWSTLASEFLNIDGGAVDHFHLAVGMDSNNGGLAMTSDGATAAAGNAYTQSAEYSSSWGNFIRPFTIPSTSSPISTLPTYGRPSSIFSDSGNFYLAFIDDAVTTDYNNLYLNNYSSGAWGGAATQILLSADTTSVESSFDGNTPVVSWLHKATLQGMPANGLSHQCFLSGDGSVKCLGTNTSGQLGDGTTANHSDPVFAQTLDVTSGNIVSSISAGGDTTCVLLATGAIKCWGSDSSGQVGDGAACSTAAATTYCKTPTTVTTIVGGAGAAASAQKVAVGALHACATHPAGNGGGFSCWGENGSGQLGDGTNTDRNTPTLVDAATLYDDIAAGYQHSCGARNGSNVYCWGENANGQLGNSSMVDSTTPVSTGLAGVTFLSAGGGDDSGTARAHSCGYVNGGTIYCWGENTYGQLGRGNTTTPATAPVSTLFGVPSSVASLASGYFHACAVYSVTGGVTGGVKCWGRNAEGQLGTGSTSGPNTCGSTACATAPVSVSAFGNGLTAKYVSAFGNSTCAMTTEQGLFCWGGGNPNPSKILSSDDCSHGACLMATSGQDSYLTRSLISDPGKTVLAHSQASDASGNTLVTYLQVHDAHPSCNSSATNCNVRVFARLRNTLQVWGGASRLDADLSDSLTTHYQNSGTTGGTDYYVPSTVYLGDSKFMVAYALLNVSTLISTLYTKTYTLGKGWDAAVAVASQALYSSSSELYRPYNQFKLVANGGNRATLIVQSVSTSADLAASRKYNYLLYHYDGTSWNFDKTLDSALACSVTNATCANPKIEGSGFEGGEAIYVFPAPESSGSANYRLWSVTFR